MNVNTWSVTMEVHRDGADEDFKLRGKASDTEATLIESAIAILGDEMAKAIDEGWLIVPGADPISIIEKTVEIAGKARRVKLTFAMANA